MTKDKAIEQIESYLPHLKKGVIMNILGLLENLRTEQEDDDWDLQMQEDNEAGHLDHLVDKALDEYERGESTDLFEGLEARSKAAT